MSETSTTASTWEPDWDELNSVYLDAMTDNPLARDPIECVIYEYQRQAAAAGLVMVRREDVEWIVETVDWLVPEDLVVLSHLRVALDVTSEPAPGGDG